MERDVVRPPSSPVAPRYGLAVTRPPEESLAARWLSVSVDTEAVSRSRLIGRALRAVVVDSILGGANSGTEGRLHSQVKVSRRDNGLCLLTFEYGLHSKAIQHATSLQERLKLQNLWDFGRSKAFPITRSPTPDRQMSRCSRASRPRGTGY